MDNSGYGLGVEIVGGWENGKMGEWVSGWMNGWVSECVSRAGVSSVRADGVCVRGARAVTLVTPY